MLQLSSLPAQLGPGLRCFQLASPPLGNAPKYPKPSIPCPFHLRPRRLSRPRLYPIRPPTPGWQLSPQFPSHSGYWDPKRSVAEMLDLFYASTNTFSSTHPPPPPDSHCLPATKTCASLRSSCQALLGRASETPASPKHRETKEGTPGSRRHDAPAGWRHPHPGNSTPNPDPDPGLPGLSRDTGR